MTSDVEDFFMHLLAIRMTSWVNVYSGHLLILKIRLFVFCAVELYEVLIYFGYEPFIRYMVFKYCLPFHRLSFHFVDYFTM